MADHETNTATRALKALRHRARHIHSRCEDVGPKQAIGEMLAAMESMPEWDTVAAALAAPVPAAQGATQEPVAWPPFTELPDSVVDWVMRDIGLPRHDMPDIDALRKLVQAACTETMARLPDPRYAAPVGQAEDAARPLPPLPQGYFSRRVSGSASPEHTGQMDMQPLYTAEQMHAYATAARPQQAVQSEPGDAK